MAQKRMFSLQVVDTDKFMDMPSSAQALYFHLGMHGDDDGFVASPKKIQRAAGCSDDDLRLLAAKGFLIPFDSGVVVITDWRLNNTLKNDRYSQTIYQAEMAMLSADENGKYRLGSRVDPEWNQNGSGLVPQHNITKPNLTKPNTAQGKKADRPPKGFLPPGVEEVRAYCTEHGYTVNPEQFVDYYTSNGWKVGRNSMKDWKAAVRSWDRKDRNHGENELPIAGRIGTVL